MVDGWNYIGNVLASAATPLLFVGLAFANDTVLSKSASEQITNAIKHATTAPQTSEWILELEKVLAEYFPSKGNPLRFWTYVVAFSMAAMACVRAVYCSRMPDLVAQLPTPSFLRQFLFDGLIKVAVVTAFAYRFYHNLWRAWQLARWSRICLGSSPTPSPRPCCSSS